MATGEEELLIDLECGGVGGGDAVTDIAVTCNGTMTGLTDTKPTVDISNLSNIAFGGLELAVDNLSATEETKDVVVAVGPLEKKQKKPNAKKSSKPPRPPKGPVLTAYDLKLVKELTELAARKRARIERIKALRKIKAAKRSTSSGSVPAMILSAVFFVILIFQAAFSGCNIRKEIVVASPAPATFKEGSVPFQVVDNALANQTPLRSSHRKLGINAR